MAVYPLWLTLLAQISLVLAALCALIIAVDEMRRPQPMWIMNLVWPLCALFGSLIWLWFYFRWGRGRAPDEPNRVPSREHGTDKPRWARIATAASHCGAGCTLGDILAEGLVFLVPAVALAFGWKSIFAEKIFAVWVLDFVVAFVLGIGFQYFTIMPMGHLPPLKGLQEALKADTASIAAWQIGMYAFMAVAQFAWFVPVYGAPVAANRPTFWLMMQIAMLCGFLTGYPVNWLLLKIGVKAPM